MSSASHEWKLKRREAQCARCERVFEEGEPFFSVLVVEEDMLGRVDHCPACFAERPESPGELVWWRTRRQAAPKRGLAVDFESVEALFLALIGREEERLRELCYLLSLLLMRKRRVKLVRVRRSAEGETMVLRRPRREEELEVSVFDLTPERMEVLRRELERIVEGAGAEDVLAGPAPVPEPEEPEQSDEAEQADQEPGAASAQAPPEAGDEATATDLRGRA